MSGELVVLEESDSYVLWEETEFCDICLKVTSHRRVRPERY